MAHVYWKLKVFLYTFGFFTNTRLVHCATHYLQYVYTTTSEVRSMTSPVYSAVGVYDDIQISHYSNEKQKWIKENLTADDWRNGPLVPPESREWFLHLYYTLANCTHSTCPEPHTLQRRIGCEVKTTSSVIEKMAYDEYGFDGVELIALNFETMQWITKNNMAEDVKTKWDNKPDRSEYLRDYLNNCLTWISTYKPTMSPPNIQMFVKKAPHDQRKMDLTCLSTGFYPKHIQMDITLNGIQLESLNTTGVRPNNDKTFQLRSTVKIKREDKEGFECHVTHISLIQPKITKWDGKCTNCHEEPRTHAAAIIVAVAFVAALLIMCIYRKKTLNGESKCLLNIIAIAINNI